MSVLNGPQKIETSAATRVAQELKEDAYATFQQLVYVFTRGANEFWRNPQAKPSEIATALGTDAKEVFELHGKIGALLATVKPEVVAEGASVVGSFSYNEDGTVTVVDPE